jgi:hypothetical protein
MNIVHDWKVIIRKPGAHPAAETEVAAVVLTFLG